FIKGLGLKEAVIKRALQDRELYATKQADGLVRGKKIPFKKAHDIVGKWIREQENLEEK
ncbi:MAG: argininosuccinate lyase, partial [Candidatus Omnitrophica bacterium]|nr:argininosuccinate lyase [Candidatus Omnitrophota bacterium]